MSKTAVKSFMPPAAVRADALPWLADTAQLAQESAPDWVRALRATAAESFAATGLPTPAWEGWQYANLRPFAAARFRYCLQPPTAPALPAPLLGDSFRLVVINGQYQPARSTLPPQVTVMPLLEAAEKDIPGLQDSLVTLGDLASAPFRALNTAYMRDGFVLSVPPHADIDKPVEVLFYTQGNDNAPIAVHPRIAYLLGENSGLTVVEHYTGSEGYLFNGFTAATLGASARFRLYRTVDEAENACHVNDLAVRAGKAAVFEGFSSAIGGQAVRQAVGMQLIDSGISASISGIYLLRNQQSHDFTILADHFEPDGKSVQLFKGVIDDKARAVFQGKIHVHRPAQKTDGYQSHHALLLSGEAEAIAKPELEIYADDVKCSHGATSGFFDPEALFYLRSRGIPQAEARALLIESFLNEVVDTVSFEPVRDVYRGQVAAWLARQTQAKA